MKLTDLKKTNRENFKKVIDWVQENIADKCPEAAILTGGIATDRYRVRTAGVLEVKGYDGCVAADWEHRWMRADDAVDMLSDRCIAEDFLLNWELDRACLEALFEQSAERQNLLENFEV